MSNVIQLQPKEAISADGLIIPFEKINDSFMEGQLKSHELALVFKKFPKFHRWFLTKHRSKFT